MTRHSRLLASVLAAAAAAAGAARALGPHEIAVLVNASSARSREVAHQFIHLRRIPAANVVYLTLPESALAPSAEITTNDFTRLIWEPAHAALKAHDALDHILAWAYSADFPLRIAGEQPVSLTGITFARNRLPPAEAIKLGAATSPLFAGPAQNAPARSPSRTLEQYAMALQGGMPLPAMVLGHCGSRGLAPGRVADLLRQSAAADRSAPKGIFYFQQGSDVRVTAREWQFADAAAELRARGQEALISATPPGGVRTLAGVMAGSSSISPGAFGKLAPGAFAEHLTSFGAVFAEPSQTKLTAWLDAGAAGSSGTVCEPYAQWRKFPHARLFAHYAAGCTLLESFAQAVASPFQILPVGDPLAQPWGRSEPLTLANLSESGETIRGGAQILLSTLNPAALAQSDVVHLLDGRVMTGAPRSQLLRFDTASLPDGYHEFRTVLYGGGDIRHQSFAQLPLPFNNRGRAVTLRQTGGDVRQVSIHRPLRLEVEIAGDEPEEVSILRYDDPILTARVRGKATLQIDPLQAGPGPVILQAAARHKDGMVVRSNPVSVDIRDLNQAPTIVIGAVEPKGDGFTAEATASDPDGDEVSLVWARRLAWPAERTMSGNLDGTARLESGRFRMTPIRKYATAALGHVAAKPASFLEANVQFASLAATTSGFPAAGIVWNRSTADAYAFAAFSAAESAWILGTCTNGAWRKAVACGAPMLQEGRTYRMRVDYDERNGAVLSVDGTVVARWKDAPPLERGLGIAGTDAPVDFLQVVAGPADRLDKSARISGGKLSATGNPANFVITATDGHATSAKSISANP